MSSVYVVSIIKVCLHACCLFSDDQLDLESAIRVHNFSVVTKTDNPYHIVVRRENALADGLAAIVNKPDDRALKITFHGEPGIDEGGVRREFFTLVLRKVSQSPVLMDGAANRRVLRHNVIAVQVSSKHELLLSNNCKLPLHHCQL